MMPVFYYIPCWTVILSLVAVSTELCGEVSSIKNSGCGTSFDAIVSLLSHYTHLSHTFFQHLLCTGFLTGLCVISKLTTIDRTALWISPRL